MLEVMTSSKIVLEDRGGYTFEGDEDADDYYDDYTGSGDYDDELMPPDPALEEDWKSEDRGGKGDGDYDDGLMVPGILPEDIKGWNN